MTTRVEKLGKTQELSGKTQELSGKYKSTNTECKKNAHLFLRNLCFNIVCIH